MANQALAKPGAFVLDTFAGTGSLLVALVRVALRCPDMKAHLFVFVFVSDSRQ